jgi:quercetin dioxygenase-like cupin family protein
MTSGFVLGPGEGSAYGFHGSAVVIKASGEHTLGQLGVMESAYPPGLSVHEHVHADEDEMFYLLEGELEVSCGEAHWTVTPGCFVFVPRDSPHGFTVTSTEPARALVITGPSRLDRQIAARAEPVPPGLAGQDSGIGSAPV